MADTKITALTALTAADPASDVLPIVDISDTTMAASGTTKKISVNNILGAGGTATLASATISGDLTVDTSTLKVDSTNNYVGVGTAAPIAQFMSVLNATGIAGRLNTNTIGSAIAASYQVSGITNGTLPLGIRCTGNAFAGISGQLYASQIVAESTNALALEIFNTGNTPICFGVNGTETMRLNATGLGVGISPAYKGHFYNTGASTELRIENGSTTAGFTNRLSFKSASGALDARTGVIEWYDVGTFKGDIRLLKAGGIQIRNSADSPTFNLDNTGNLGIGVVPSAWGSGTKALEFANGSVISFAGYIGTVGTANSYYNGTNFIYKTTAAAARYDQDAGAHKWFNAPSGTAGNTVTFTQAMTLAATGNLLVGTTTDIAAVRMQVWSADSNNTAYFRNSNATTPYGPSVKYTAATPNNTGSEFLYCEDSTAVRVALRSNGGIANYQANNVSLSDSRMKSDIKPLGSYWNKIKSLEVVTFKYNDQTHSDDNIGLIAQQVESVAPELVDVDGFGETPVDGVPLKTIYTTDLYHASIKALQEAMSRIEALEAKLA